jgi:UDP-3-O-[3-hydroxymyristoyl] glucosamine N-acyltransferase
LDLGKKVCPEGKVEIAPKLNTGKGSPVKNKTLKTKNIKAG